MPSLAQSRTKFKLEPNLARHDCGEHLFELKLDLTLLPKKSEVI